MQCLFEENRQRAEKMDSYSVWSMVHLFLLAMRKIILKAVFDIEKAVH